MFGRRDRRALPELAMFGLKSIYTTVLHRPAAGKRALRRPGAPCGCRGLAAEPRPCRSRPAALRLTWTGCALSRADAMPLPLSVLDVVPVASDAAAGQALRNSL